MNCFELREIRCQLGAFRLRIDELSLEQGAVYAVAGPNGCGKSTLLNLLAMLVAPDEGRMHFKHAPVRHGDTDQLLGQRRRIGYLMQDPYLFNMKVRDNIGYGLKLRGLPAREVAARTNAMLERLAIAGLADRRAHELSGGEAQRVAVARTLVLDADAYLLDEPTANVDQRNVRVVEELILEQSRARNATVVFATHARDQAYRMTRNLISVVNGRIRDIAYENVFAGTLAHAEDGGRVVTIDGALAIRVTDGRDGPVTIAVDPQDIVLSPEPFESSALNRFCGAITRIESFGETLRVFVDVGVAFCALITRSSYEQLNLNIGKEIWLTFKATAVRVL